MNQLNIVGRSEPRQSGRYDERMVAPMREELTRIGFAEARTAEAVDAQVKDAPGTTMVVVNSICGCATARAREYFAGYGPSSPQMGLLKDGKLVFMLERRDIEGREAQQIADDLLAAFEEHWAKA